MCCARLLLAPRAETGDCAHDRRHLSQDRQHHRNRGLCRVCRGRFLILLSYGLRWLATDPRVWPAGFWGAFLDFAITTIPLNVSTLVGLVLSTRLDWQDRPIRRTWMIAIWLYLANTVFTLDYIIPQNILLIWDSHTAAQASQVRATWLGLHVLRVVIATAVSVYAILAVIRRAEAGSATRQQIEQRAP